jgi:hypothetical protein
MTPRIDIIAVDASATRDEVVATLQGSEHARLVTRSTLMRSSVCSTPGHARPIAEGDDADHGTP